MTCILFFICVIISISLLRLCLNAKESLNAVRAWCGAGELFLDWRFRNQGVYIGLSDEGKMLLSNLINAYDWFLNTHKYVEDHGHRNYLVNLFDDLPPNQPNNAPAPKKRHPRGVSFVFCPIFQPTFK